MSTMLTARTDYVRTGETEFPTGIPALKQAKRLPLHTLLNVTLANGLDLKSRVMRARWSARQSANQGLCATYDEFTEDLDLLTDLLGQRITSLGISAVAVVKDVTRVSRLPPHPRTIDWDSGHVVAIRDSIETTRRYTDAAIDAALAEGEVVSADILARLRRRLDVKSKALIG